MGAGKVILPCGHSRAVSGREPRADGLCSACWRKSPEGRAENREAQRYWRMGQEKTGLTRVEIARKAAETRWGNGR